MTNLDRSETLRRIATDQLRIATLVNDLTRSASILAADIEHEEAQTGVRDLRNSEYPVLARNLRARRDNLLATVLRWRRWRSSAPGTASKVRPQVIFQSTVS
jgi:hypothetical protein